MVGWHHRFHGHELEQALGAGEGQGSLACHMVCHSPWGRKESDATWQLNNHNSMYLGESKQRCGLQSFLSFVLQVILLCSDVVEGGAWT